MNSDLTLQLVDNHRQFLAFLERRVGDRALAEDILQDAFVKSLQKAEDERDETSSVAWFYRTLRNAVIDHSCSTTRVPKRSSPRIFSVRYVRLSLGGATLRIVGTDGGLIETPVEATEVLLPPADRVELLVGPASPRAARDRLRPFRVPSPVADQ